MATKKALKKKFCKEIAHLEVLLRFSLKAVDNSSEELDSLFTNQANKIRKKIKDLEKKQ